MSSVREAGILGAMASAASISAQAITAMILSLSSWDKSSNPGGNVLDGVIAGPEAVGKMVDCDRAGGFVSIGVCCKSKIREPDTRKDIRKEMKSDTICFLKKIFSY